MTERLGGNQSARLSNLVSFHHWNELTRRKVLRLTVAGSVLMGAAPRAWPAGTKTGMPYRTLGKTREKVSALGLGGDHVDLMQFHEIIRMEDPDRIFAPGGALEAVQEAKKAGKIRYIGFTGHKDPLIHLRMIEVAAEHNFHFDTAQMPLNVMDAHFRSFGQQVL